MLFFITLTASLFIFSPISPYHADYSLNVIEVCTASTSRVTDAPIKIENNSAFLGFSSQGDGTAQDPYIIENLLIDATTNHGILLRDTNANAVIKNCTIIGGSSNNTSGIRIEDCHNISIENCSLTHNFIGIDIRCCSSQITILNNNISSNKDRGIYSENAIFLDIEQNTLSGNGGDGINILLYALEMSESGNSTIAYNFCTQNSNDGIEITGLLDSIIANNTCVDNIAAGLSLLSGERCDFVGNNCSENSMGMSLRVNNSTICENLCVANSVYGLSIDQSRNNTLCRNYFNDNGFDGVLFKNSDNNLLKSNFFSKNQRYGLYIQDSNSNQITQNRFFDNSERNIKIEGVSRYNSFSENQPHFWTLQEKLFLIGGCSVISLIGAVFITKKVKKKI